MNNRPKEKMQKQSTLQLIILHLLPGAIATAIYVLLVPFAAALGYPSITVLYLPMILTVILLEFGYLLILAQKRNGNFSLDGIVAYREPVPPWQYIAFPVLIVIWGVIVTGLVSPIDNLVLNKLFARLPDWYTLRNLLELPHTFPRGILFFTAVCAVILNGILGPVIEELYFRGHLLPRMARFGHWAPVLNVVLFSFYHFWTPWNFFSRVVLLLPMVYLVWWKRNIYVGMIAHCLLNLIGTTVLFAQLLGR